MHAEKLLELGSFRWNSSNSTNTSVSAESPKSTVRITTGSEKNQLT